MPKYLHIGSYGQNQALRAHGWAKIGQKTAEARPDWHYRDWIGIRTRLSYVYGHTCVCVHTRVEYLSARLPLEKHMEKKILGKLVKYSLLNLL